jgi:oxygen-dependent protoporphyrinogen oxidase
MRGSGRHAIYKHALKRVSGPQTRHGQFLRAFTSTTSNQKTLSAASGDKIHLLDSPNPKAKNVAVLGGGITGLASAWHLSKHIPDAKITIFEKSPRVGGWVDSDTITVEQGKVLFEWGPRTLRPAGGPSMATIDLLADLGLQEEILAVSKSSPASLNRFIYYPDHLALMPGPGRGLWETFRRLSIWWKEPIFAGVLPTLLREPLRPPRDPDVKDESIGRFLERRFGKALTNNIASAFFHGIYAGDIYNLSARTLLPLMWYLEARDRERELGILGEAVNLRLSGTRILPEKDIRFARLRSEDTSHGPKETRVIKALLKQASVYTFKRGLGQVTSAIETAFSSNPNVEIRISSPVEDAVFDQNTQSVAITSNGATSNYDYVVSTLGPKETRTFLASGAKGRGTSLASTVTTACERSSHSVNVMVVNLYYQNPDLIPRANAGFGYLLPRSVPFEENPERALGVIFSSETSGRPGTLVPGSGEVRDGSAQEADSHPGQDTAPGTKITVMLGGHWWTQWDPQDLPDEEQAIDMAKSLLKRHLDIDDMPEVAQARLQRNCIPQYPVGYREDMATVHDALLSEYQGRFKVAGPWWQGGVGVNDCVRAAREASWAVRHQWDDKTGLEQYAQDEVWCLVNPKLGKIVPDPGR